MESKSALRKAHRQWLKTATREHKNALKRMDRRERQQAENEFACLVAEREEELNRAIAALDSSDDDDANCTEQTQLEEIAAPIADVCVRPTDQEEEQPTSQKKKRRRRREGAGARLEAEAQSLAEERRRRGVSIRQRGMEALAALGFTVRDSAADGSCLFQSIGAHLGMTAAAIRSEIANYIENNLDDFAPFITNPPKYLAKLRKKMWGGEPELVAACRCFGIKLTVVHTDGSRTAFGDATGAPYLLGYINERPVHHYVPLFPL